MSMPSHQWREYVERARARYGDKLDLGAIDRRFLPYFQTGQRIKVRRHDEEITGTVSASLGWQPVLLLIRRSNSMGSSDVLDRHCELVAVQIGRKNYVPVAK